MSVNYLNRLEQKAKAGKWLRSSWVFAIALPVWVLVGLALAVLVAYVLASLLSVAGVPLSSMDATIFNAMFAASVYALTVLFVLGVPHLFKRHVSWKSVGLQRLPSWTDIGLAPLGFVVYFIASSLLVYLATLALPGFDLTQIQETGFTRLTADYEYTLAFITLIVVAPIAEEVLFRGFLYGKLRSRTPVWVAIIVTSVLFGFIHGQWNVGIDTFALSIILCSLREMTGSIWAGVLLHMLKNSVAFFIIFITPML
jgi:uncharacterized protein